MDWSSVYEESGDEQGIWPSFETWGSRVTLATENFSIKSHYSPLICYLFTVNYILGVGCLGIPYAFNQCGILLGTIIVVVVSFVSYMTVLWVAEAATVYNCVLDKYEMDIVTSTPQKKCPTSERDKLLSSDDSKIYHSFYLPKDVSRRRANSIVSTDSVDVEQVAEVSAIVGVFLGPTGNILYQSSLMMLTYIGLVAYCLVFTKSFISQIYPSSPTYTPILLFGIVTIPLSCMDLADQVYIQVAMSVMRFLTLAILVIGLMVAIFFDKADSSASNLSVGHPPYLVEEIPFVQTEGAGLMFSTAIFSQLFQHSVPGLMRPLLAEEKEKVPRIFGAALFTTGLLYIIIGVISVLYFGNEISQSINLNFVDFHWGVRRPLVGDTSNQAVIFYLCSIFSTTVVIFPALDTLSVFPLIANTLGNNMLAASHWWRQKTESFVILLSTAFKINETEGLSKAEKKMYNAWIKQKASILSRLVAAVPPILACFIVTNLAVTLQLAGLCGIIVALVTPALLLQKSLSFFDSGALTNSSSSLNKHFDGISHNHHHPHKKNGLHFANGVIASRKAIIFVFILAACASCVCLLQLLSTI